MSKWMQRPEWEYKVYRKTMPVIRDTDQGPHTPSENSVVSDMEDRLNYHGETGWELVSHTVHVEPRVNALGAEEDGFDVCVYTYTFKRWVVDQKIRARKGRKDVNDSWMPLSARGY